MLLVVRKRVYIKELQGLSRTTVFQCHPSLCKRDWSLANYQTRKSRTRFRPPTLESLSKYVVQRRLGITPLSEPESIRNVSAMHKMTAMHKAEQGPKFHYKIWLSILATCKVIYFEAAHVVYRQKFTFADTGTLHNFILLLGPVPRKKLSDIQVLGRGDSRSITSAAIPAFSALAEISNLKRLRVSCPLGVSQDWAWVNVFPPRKKKARPSYHLPAEMIASKVYRDCAHWLRPMFLRGGMHGIKRALRLDKRNFMPVLRSSQNPLPPFTKDLYQKMQTRFWAYLEILLVGYVM